MKANELGRKVCNTFRTDTIAFLIILKGSLKRSPECVILYFPLAYLFFPEKSR